MYPHMPTFSTVKVFDTPTCQNSHLPVHPETHPLAHPVTCPPVDTPTCPPSDPPTCPTQRRPLHSFMLFFMQAFVQPSFLVQIGENEMKIKVICLQGAECVSENIFMYLNVSIVLFNFVKFSCSNKSIKVLVATITFYTK